MPCKVVVLLLKSACETRFLRLRNRQFNAYTSSKHSFYESDHNDKLA